MAVADADHLRGRVYHTKVSGFLINLLLYGIVSGGMRRRFRVFSMRLFLLADC